MFAGRVGFPRAAALAIPDPVALLGVAGAGSALLLLLADLLADLRRTFGR